MMTNNNTNQNDKIKWYNIKTLYIRKPLCVGTCGNCNTPGAINKYCGNCGKKMDGINIG